jgi:tetratricopeptide (TPR) repeat protein
MARNPQMNYAMAWSFVNFLLSTTEGQQAFNEILRIVGGGGDLKKLLHPRLWKEIERLWHEDAKTRVALYDQLLAPYAEHPNLSDDQRGALLKKARQQYADLPDPWFYSAEAALKSGDHAAALKHLQEVEKRDDTWPDLDRLMGVCYFRTDEHMKATKHLRKALPITQNHEHKEEIREMMREIRQSRWQR